ncbi:uncharacterized protein ISCGN_029148 [Ixodes scapularis]
MLGKKKTTRVTQSLALKMDKPEKDLAEMAGELFFPQPPLDATDGFKPYMIEMLAPDPGMDSPFTPGELEAALHVGKAHTAPGPDKVTMTMLRNLPDQSKEEYLKEINNVWATGKLPEEWKHSSVVPIPKPGKDKGSITNYRPISLTSCTCKVMERMVLKRIEWFLETTGGFHATQTGFRPGLGTQESLMLISKDIIKKKKKMIRTIVAIDVKKAFDSVPHAAVIGEAQSLGISGRPLNFIRSFLEGRTYSVRCGREQGGRRTNRIGVPQGSVISPMLFNIVMAALPHQLEQIEGLGLTVYADDVTIWTQTGDLYQQQETLQAGLDVIENHLRKVGLSAAPEKTKYVVLAPFKERTEKIGEKMTLVLAGKRILPSREVKVLGLVFEETGTGDIWLQQTSRHCHSALGVIRRLCSVRGGGTLEVAKNMVKALVTSRVCYGARHYNLTKVQWERLETLNRHAMRVITGLPFFTKKIELEKWAQLNTLQDTVQARVVAHEERLQHTKQGRQILGLLGNNLEDLPNLPEWLPPWEDMADITERRPLRDKKGDEKRNERIAKAHRKMVEHWTDPSEILAVYTDHARDDTPTPAGAAAFLAPAVEVTECCQLPARTTIKGGELEAILLALNLFARQRQDLRPRELRLFTDSKEAVRECKKASSASRKVKEIKKMAAELRQLGTTIKIGWIPGHAGIPGNEKVHQLARAALVSFRERGGAPTSSQPHDHGYAAPGNGKTLCDDEEYDPDEERILIKERYRTRLWERLPQTPDLLPRGIGRRDKVLLTRIMAGATRSPARMAAWSKGRRSSTCNKCTNNIKGGMTHLLWECPYYQQIRTKFKPIYAQNLDDWVHPKKPSDKENGQLSLLNFVLEAKLDVYV